MAVSWLLIIVDFLATRSWLGVIIYNSYGMPGVLNTAGRKCATAPDDRSRRTHRLWKIWRRSSLSQKDPPFAYGCGVLMMPHDWFGCWCSCRITGSFLDDSIHRFSAPDWSRQQLFWAVLSLDFPRKAAPNPYWNRKLSMTSFRLRLQRERADHVTQLDFGGCTLRSVALKIYRLGIHGHQPRLSTLQSFANGSSFQLPPGCLGRMEAIVLLGPMFLAKEKETKSLGCKGGWPREVMPQPQYCNPSIQNILPHSKVRMAMCVIGRWPMLAYMQRVRFSHTLIKHEVSTCDLPPGVCGDLDCGPVTPKALRIANQEIKELKEELQKNKTISVL